MTPSGKNIPEVFVSEDELYKAAARFIISLAKKYIDEKGRFILSLAGGQTPVKLYELLSKHPFREQISWNQVFIFWGDERCVPLNDERNNAHVAKKTFLDKINIPISNIHPIPVNLPPKKAASAYEKELYNFFGDKNPQFDLILLGLGENGHTASLFPGTKMIDEQLEGVREVYVEEEKMFRITLTARLINQSHHILFLVTGLNKAEILKKVLTTHYNPHLYPAQLIQPANGKLYWYADSAAASLL